MNKKSSLFLLAFAASIATSNAETKIYTAKIPRKMQPDGPITVHTKTTKGGWFRTKTEEFQTYELIPRDALKHMFETMVDTENKDIPATIYNASENFPQKDARVFKKIGLIPMVMEINNNSNENIRLNA